MTRRELRELRAREERARRDLLRGAQARFWLGAAVVLSTVAAVTFVVVGQRINVPISWAALGVTAGLLAGMVIVTVLLPLTIRRATLLAWFLSGLVAVSLGTTGVLVSIEMLS